MKKQNKAVVGIAAFGAVCVGVVWKITKKKTVTEGQIADEQSANEKLDEIKAEMIELEQIREQSGDEIEVKKEDYFKKVRAEAEKMYKEALEKGLKNKRTIGFLK